MTSKITKALAWKGGFSYFDWWVGAALIIVLLSMHLPTYRTGGWAGKEGISLYESALTAEGHVPYRDFDSFYAPLTTYFHALIFSIGGVSIDNVRMLLMFVIILNALALYVLSRRLLPSVQAGLVSLVGVAYYSFPPHNYATLYAVFFSLITLIVLARSLESELTPGSGFWIGLGTGLTSVIHHPVAVYLALTIIGSVVLAPFLSPRKVRRYALRDILLFISIFVLTGAGVALPVYGTFASFSSWSALILQLFPPEISGGVGLHLLPLSLLIPKEISGPEFYRFCAGAFFWIPLLLVILTVILFVREIVRPSGAPILYLLTLTLFQIFMESKNIAVGIPNLLYIQATFVLAGYWGFEYGWDSKKWTKVIVWCVFGGWLLLEVASWAVTPLVGRAKPVYRITSGRDTLYLSSTLGKSTEGLMKFIENNTGPNDPVAVFPDGTFLSVIARKPNPFRTTIVATNLDYVRSEKFQKGMIETLEQDKVPYVVILEWAKGYYFSFRTNEVPIFSRYFAEKYAAVTTIGAMKPPLLSFAAHVYKRKSGSQP